MPDESVILINLLKIDPANQHALIALLKQNINAVITTLDGWKASRLIADEVKLDLVNRLKLEGRDFLFVPYVCEVADWVLLR